MLLLLLLTELLILCFNFLFFCLFFCNNKEFLSIIEFFFYYFNFWAICIITKLNSTHHSCLVGIRTICGQNLVQLLLMVVNRLLIGNFECWAEVLRWLTINCVQCLLGFLNIEVNSIENILYLARVYVRKHLIQHLQLWLGLLLAWRLHLL